MDKDDSEWPEAACAIQFHSQRRIVQTTSKRIDKSEHLLHQRVHLPILLVVHRAWLRTLCLYGTPLDQ